MRGTDIYYISGRKPAKIGWGQFYPTDLTADSVPNVDGWFPDNYWGKQAYRDWFALNMQKYGLATAKSKMNQAIDTWSLGGAEWSYCYDSEYLAFFDHYGVSNVATYQCRVLVNAGEVIADVTDTAANTTKLLKWALPVVLIVGAIWFGKPYVEEGMKKLKRKKP